MIPPPSKKTLRKALADLVAAAENAKDTGHYKILDVALERARKVMEEEA